jgi:hypothetical protein
LGLSVPVHAQNGGRFVHAYYANGGSHGC